MDTDYEVFELSCQLAQDFTRQDPKDAAYDALTAAQVLIATLEHLHARLGPGASLTQLDPAALIAQLARSVPNEVGLFAEVLRDFYAWLKATERLDPAACQYLACYFSTLLELHGSGPNGMSPNRASRRTTATLARRITEARIRTDARKKSAA